jgi:transmembrane sensor
MSARNPSEIRDEVISEACAWFVELNEYPLSPSIREAFDRWLRRSPEHVHAYLQASASWEEGTPHPQLPVESIGELVALAKTDSNIVRLSCPRDLPLTIREENSANEPGGPSRTTTAETREFYQKRQGRCRLAMAASIVLIVAAGVVLWHHYLQGVYSTGIGEQYTVTLGDGSTVELNARSRVRIRYAPRERHVDLLEGQALFRVAKDTSRPFIVQSQDAQVRAVGTQFDVYRKGSGTIVTVVEGRVAVTPAQPQARSSQRASNTKEKSSWQPGASRVNSAHVAVAGGENLIAASKVLVDAGERLTIERGGATATPLLPQPANIEAATAWTQHRLIFKGAPLSEVAAEFNRYGRKSLIITDPTIAATRVSGSFSWSDPAALLSFLREVGAYDVRETSSVIEVSRK